MFNHVISVTGVSCSTFQFMRGDYSQTDFVKIIQLIDLCSLDVKSVEYRFVAYQLVSTVL